MGRTKKTTLTERARTTVPGFDSMYKKLEQKVKLSGLSASTLINYGRSMAKIALHFGKVPLDLEDEDINEYLLELKAGEQPSESYFKHTVYGLRYLFRLFGREDRAIKLPPLKRKRQLPVVLSRAECKRLFRAPKLLKHRVMLALAYSAGLRLSELIALRPEDIDSGRMQILVRQGKGNKDRYVVLSSIILTGLRKYYLACRPKGYLFNGQASA
ncbi:MAG: tyrosine-type recombinase/integrase [Lewinellaceae bacterium]|nr:tyrosine-type recombinase/integrase [Lewinellaceae bacterium]